MVKPGRKPARVEPSIVALEELNISEFPLAVLSDYAPGGLKTLKFHDHIEDAKTGKTLNRSVTVSGSDEWGLPNWQDQDVLLALMALTEQKHGFQKRQVSFSLYELCKLLRWEVGGAQYERLADSLDRWTGVTIKYSHWRFENRWKKNQAFHIIERYQLSNGRDYDAENPEELQTFTWNEVVWENLRAGHRKLIDWDFYLSLRTPTAKRLYRFLDKRFFLKRSWKFDLANFCWEKIGISKCEVSQLKQRLRSAVKELETKGFLKPMAEKERYPRIGKGRFDAHFVRSPKWAKSHCPQPTPEPTTENPLEAALLERRVTNAAVLVSKFPAEQIARQIENYDDRQQNGDKLSPGWLRKAVEEDYGFRKGFQPQAEREAIAARSVASAKRVAEKRNREEEADRQQRQQQKKALAKFLESLENDQARADFQVAALQSQSFLRKQYQTASSKKLADDCLQAALMAHWQRQLKTPKTQV